MALGWSSGVQAPLDVDLLRCGSIHHVLQFFLVVCPPSSSSRRSLNVCLCSTTTTSVSFVKREKKIGSAMQRRAIYTVHTHQISSPLFLSRRFSSTQQGRLRLLVHSIVRRVMSVSNTTTAALRRALKKHRTAPSASVSVSVSPTENQSQPYACCLHTPTS